MTLPDMHACRARDLLGRQTSEPSTAQLAQAYRLPYKLGADKARGTVTVADAKGTTYAAEELVVRPAARTGRYSDPSSGRCSDGSMGMHESLAPTRLAAGSLCLCMAELQPSASHLMLWPPSLTMPWTCCRPACCTTPRGLPRQQHQERPLWTAC